MNQIGQRLREERERLGLSQTALGAIGGVQQNAQFLYEKDQRSPNADYLHALANIGADTHYIVTGQRTTGALHTDEEALITGFRAAPLVVKGAILGALQGATTAAKTGALLPIHPPTDALEDNKNKPES